MEKIKLLWDFKGPDAQKTAAHHEIHLKDFIKTNATALNITGVEKVNEFHSIAFMVVTKPEMKNIRDTLKPHRGQVYLQ